MTTHALQVKQNIHLPFRDFVVQKDLLPERSRGKDNLNLLTFSQAYSPSNLCVPLKLTFQMSIRLREKKQEKKKYHGQSKPIQREEYRNYRTKHATEYISIHVLQICIERVRCLYELDSFPKNSNKINKILDILS